MKIAVINEDGGTGKSAISYALGKELDLYYFTNEDNAIVRIYESGFAKIIEADNMKIVDNSIYDFAGATKSGVLNIVKNCDIAIVPCINDLNSKAKAIKTIKSIEPLCNNILVIATKLMKNKDIKEIKEDINSIFPNIEIIASRYTDLYKNALEFSLSPLELIRDSKAFKRDNKNFIEEYKNILKYILSLEEFEALLKEKA